MSKKFAVAYKLLFVFLFLVIILEQMVCSQTIGLNISDILGRPSRVVMRSSSHKISRSIRKHKVHVAEGKKKKEQKVAFNNQAVKKATPKISIAQNITFDFVDQIGRPVTDLTVAVNVQTKSSATTVVNSTNERGQVVLSKVTPLPASFSIAIDSRKLPSFGEPEWELVEPEMASLLISTGTGTKVAENMDSREPYQLASLVALTRSAPKTKTVTYQTSRKITLRRNYVDLALVCPADAKVSCTSPDQIMGTKYEPEIQRDGDKARFTLPASWFGQGCVPICLSADRDGALFESVISDYPHSEYAQENVVEAPEPSLVCLKSSAIPECASLVLRDSSAVEAAYSELRGRNRDSSTVEQGMDGSAWWKAERSGVWLKVRQSPFVANAVVECARMSRPTAGSVAGIRVGDDRNRLLSILGPGKESSRKISYMDDGVRFNLSGDTIESIDILRPKELLAEGTTAFVCRQPADVYVEDFQADCNWKIGCQIQSIFEFKDYLVRTGVVRIVDKREDADYVLNCQANNFKEHRSELFGSGAIPLEYECSLDLTYSLTDAVTNEQVIANKTVSGKAGASYKKEVVEGAALIVLIEKLWKGDTTVKRIIEALIGIKGVDALQESLKRANIRCPKLAEQNVYNKLADDLYRVIDCNARVTKIDYSSGYVTLNVGSREGVRGDRIGESPASFELLVGGRALPSTEAGFNADFYAARVISVDEHSCVCKLEHITRGIRKKTREEIVVKDASEMVSKLPDPATGVVSARMRSRLLPLVEQSMSVSD